MHVTNAYVLLFLASAKTGDTMILVNDRVGGILVVIQIRHY